MQIIPVIDLMRGAVVHARGGNRAHYQPVKSVLTRSSNPIQVIRDLLDFYPFSRIYIADLDAIETGVLNSDFYRQLIQLFPRVEFWVDSGIKQSDEFMHRMQEVALRYIVGSETLQDMSLLNLPLFRQQGILSLDFKAGQLIGDEKILQQTSNWPENIIAMSLDSVGSDNGPDMALLRDLQARSPDREWFAAGGVRDETDLDRLQHQHIAGALIASCLHNGKLVKEQIEQYWKQEHRPS